MDHSAALTPSRTAQTPPETLEEQAGELSPTAGQLVHAESEERARKVAHRRLEWMASQVTGNRVLDVGTGDGDLARLLALEGFQVLGIDIDPEAISRAESRATTDIPLVRDNTQFRNVTLFQNIEELEFDTVIVGNVIEHVANIENFVKTAVSHLTMGGRLVLTTPFGADAYADGKGVIFLSEVHDFLLPYGDIVWLDVQDGFIRAVLERRAQPGRPFDPAELLALTENATYASQNRYASQLRLAKRYLSNQAEAIEDGRIRLMDYRSQLEASAATLDELQHQQLEFERMSAENARIQPMLENEARVRATLDALRIEHDSTVGLLAGAQDRATAAEAALVVVNAEAADLKAALEVASTENALILANIKTIADERDQMLQRLEESSSKLTAAVSAERAASTEIAHLKEAAARAEIDRESLLSQLELLSADAAALEERLYQQTLARRPAHDAPAPSPANCTERMQAWAQNLPVTAADVAAAWLRTARAVEASDPVQALQMIHAAHKLAPCDASSRSLGFALLSAGDAAGGMEILDAVSEEMNLSSRERRLLALARDGYSGAQLAEEAETVTRSRLRVAAIMDEFTANSYAPECELQQLSVNGWRLELQSFDPELLLIESAWRGLNDQWGGKVGQLSPEVQDILSWCRENSVPTAFWNKEDPVHFDTFLGVAREFDTVFTTDIDCVPRYRAALGHDRVWFLPFACQPELHNPIDIGERRDAFCFAGAYYARYPDRTRDLDSFIEKLSTYKSIDIFDRNYGKDIADYQFPEHYQQFIVGTLPASQIDRAYKGYRYGINLNSVKTSQSMYARRVYELLASNTLVISNYSPGLRLMFGDLTIATDSGDEALRRMAARVQDGCEDRVRLAGLRKVLSEHTYGHRLSYIADKLGLDPRHRQRLPRPIVLARADNQAELELLLAAFERQSLREAEMIVVTPDDLGLPMTLATDRVRHVPKSTARELRISDLVSPDDWIAGFVHSDHYGKNYLKDLILATLYSSARIIGKACYRSWSGGETATIQGRVYADPDSLALRRSLAHSKALAAERLGPWLDGLPEAVVTASPATPLFAIDPFNYYEGGATLGAPGNLIAETDDLLDLDVGLSLRDLTLRAEAMSPTREQPSLAPSISGADIAAGMGPETARVSWTCDGDEWTLRGHMQPGQHDYVYEQGTRRLDDLASPEGLTLYLDAGPGYYMVMAVVFLNRDKEKISHVALLPNRNHRISPPDGAVYVRLGFRVVGTGGRTIRRLLLGEHRPAPRDIIGKSRVLLLTNHYPSYEDLYRNGFVHSRVKAYREMGGLSPDVYRLRPEQDIVWHEFENIDCMTGSAEQLDQLLATGQYDHVLVHFLEPPMWEVLVRHVENVRVTVWVHGAEVQPWHRRSYNYTTQAALEKAKAESDARLVFWRSLFTPIPPNLRFVFVSTYFAEEVFEDLGVECSPSFYDVIHNPIDSKLFSYEEKPTGQRGKILSIRPFASAKYANDLSVKAILALSKEPFFRNLSFRIVGDGPMFDDVTAPLAEFDNVICEKTFLTQPEIAALHKAHGVFLNPTRMDAQGVSRDEAMSSGLVPVTTRIAAIPEFVDESCGYLAEPEDADGLARAIGELWLEPEVFAVKSRTAAERVRRQSGKELIIAKELSLIESAIQTKNSRPPCPIGL